MTISEFSNSFDTLLNSYNEKAMFGEGASRTSITLDEYEKSVFLTQAQDQVIRNYFYAHTNVFGQGIDDSERRQIDFSWLINVGLANSYTGGTPFSDNGLLFKLPDDILYILNERVTLSDDKSYVVVPINYKEFDRIKSRAYTQPLKKQCWRLFQSDDTVESIAEIIPVAGLDDVTIVDNYTYITVSSITILGHYSSMTDLAKAASTLSQGYYIYDGSDGSYHCHVSSSGVLSGVTLVSEGTLVYANGLIYEATSSGWELWTSASKELALWNGTYYTASEGTATTKTGVMNVTMVANTSLYVTYENFYLVLSSLSDGTYLCNQNSSGTSGSYIYTVESNAISSVTTATTGSYRGMYNSSSSVFLYQATSSGWVAVTSYKSSTGYDVFYNTDNESYYYIQGDSTGPLMPATVIEIYNSVVAHYDSYSDIETDLECIDNGYYLYDSSSGSYIGYVSNGSVNLNQKITNGHVYAIESDNVITFYIATSSGWNTVEASENTIYTYNSTSYVSTDGEGTATIYTEAVNNYINGCIKEYKIRYIKRPTPIVLVDLTADNLEIDGYTEPMECKCHPSLHMDILNKATELAILAKGSYVDSIRQRQQQGVPQRENN